MQCLSVVSSSFKAPLTVPRRSGSSSAMSTYFPDWIFVTNFFGTGGSPPPRLKASDSLGSGGPGVDFLLSMVLM